MKRRTPLRASSASPDFFESLTSAIANMSATTALAGFAAVMVTALALYVVVISPVVIFPTYYRSDPTGLIRGNPLDVTLGDNLATFDGTGLTLACPAGDTNICSDLIIINNQIANINNHLNFTTNGTVDASSIAFSGNVPFFSGPVTNVGAALNDTAMRLYYNVFSFSLTPSRFPALSFPTNQLTVDEDIGRRLRLIETAPVAVNVTSLPAASITYTPSNASNWNPVPTNIQASEDQLAARVKTLEVAPFPSLSANNISYSPTNATNWNPVPTTQQGADDQLAARVKTLEVAPFPSLSANNISYTPSNSSNWNPVPTTQQGADDQLAARVRTLELAPGTLPVTSLPATNITYTNPAVFMTNVTNVNAGLNNVVGELLIHDGEITTLQSQMSTAQSNIATLQGQMGAVVYQDIFVNPTGNDGTCAVGGPACATINKAYSLVPAVVNEFAPYRILVSGYIAEGAIHARCNALLIGDDSSYSQFSSFDLDSASASSNAACELKTERIFFVPTAPMNFDISNYSSITFFSWKFENFSTQGGNNQPVTITGNGNYNILSFTQVGSSGGSISSLSIINMHVNTYSFFDNGNPMSVFCNSKDCILDLNNFRVPVGGFTTNNTNTHTMVILGSSWTNPNAQTVSFNTDAGSTTYPRGDSSFQGIINTGAASYGPTLTGAGTTGPLLTTGDVGVATLQDTPSDWDTPYPTNQHQTNTQLASRITAVKSVTVFQKTSGTGCVSIISGGYNIQAFIGFPDSVYLSQGRPAFNSSGHMIRSSATGFEIFARVNLNFAYAAGYSRLIISGFFVGSISGNLAYINHITALDSGGATDAETMIFSGGVSLQPGEQLTINPATQSTITFSSCTVASAVDIILTEIS